MITSYMMMANNQELGITMTVIIITLCFYYSRNKTKRHKQLKTIKSLREWP